MLRHPRLCGGSVLSGEKQYLRGLETRDSSLRALKRCALEDEDRFLMEKTALKNKAGGEKERGREKRMTQLREKRHFDSVLHFGDLVGELPHSTVLGAPARYGNATEMKSETRGFGIPEVLVIWGNLVGSLEKG
jgi:hypothetical protein